MIKKFTGKRERDIAALVGPWSSQGNPKIPKIEESLDHKAIDKRIRDVTTEQKIGCSYEYREEFCQNLRDAGKEKTDKFFKAILGKKKYERENFFPFSQELSDFLTRLVFINWYEPQKNYSEGEIQAFVQEHLDRLHHPRKDILIIHDNSTLRNYLGNIRNSLSWKQMNEMIDETGGDIYLVDSSYHSTTEKFCYLQKRTAISFIYEFLDRRLAPISLGGIKSSSFRKETRNTSYLDHIAYYDAYACINYIVAKNRSEFKKDYPKNPFLPLIDLHEKGIVPVGVFKDKYLIFNPPVNQTKQSN